MEKGIRIGKPPEPEAVLQFLSRQEGQKDETMDMRRKLGLIVFPLLFGILAFGVYTNFFSKEPLKKDISVPALDPADEGGSREMITPDFLRSISPAGNKVSEDSGYLAPADNLYLGYGGGGEEKMQVLRPSHEFGVLGNALPIPPGSVIEAHIDGQMDASSFSVPVVAIVDNPLMHMEREIIPRNSRIFGQTTGIQAGNRVIIRFNKLVYPDGYTEFSISGIARDENNRLGVAGAVNNNGVYRTGTSFASTVIGVGTGAVFDAGDSVFGNVARRTIENTTQDLSYEMSKNNDQHESVTVSLPPDVPIRVLITEY